VKEFLNGELDLLITTDELGGPRGHYLDLPGRLARRCRAALQETVDEWGRGRGNDEASGSGSRSPA
jgi:hypothetical protein